MRRSLAIGIVGGCLGLQLACGSGVLSSGDAGRLPAGTAGAGGTVAVTGLGGFGGLGSGGASSGHAGDPFSECMQPVAAPRVPPAIVIALDTSSAMNDLPCASCDTMSRWVSAVDAINETLPGTELDVRWGLELFGDATNACGTAGTVDVHPALATTASIAAALGARTAGGGLTGAGNRPTRSAVLAATRDLMVQNYTARSFIVLLT